ncbi:MAG TPA: dienelactone hydrolase family protein [Gemmataceae bacterium]|nr:dienelactone hydrolase family protein [Gemmataceae bacterium]
MATDEQSIRVAAGNVKLDGNLGLPANVLGVVLFAHGSGSGRHSPRNRYVAERLREAGLATLLVDLLTEDEEAVDIHTAHLRFDIGLLARRLAGAIDWLTRDPRTANLDVGLFGASTGAAAALVAAVDRPDRVRAVVSRGGRPDLAGDALSAVRAPTLLIVGGDDDVVITLNQRAFDPLGATIKELVIIPGAGHLFEEPGKLDEVARLAANWFARYLASNEGPGEH